MEPASPTLNPTQNRKPNRFVAAFSLLFLFSCLGGVGGYVAYGRIPPIYESEAIFNDWSDHLGKLVPVIPELDLSKHANQKHDELITRPSVLSQCVANCDLASLKSFNSPIQRDEIVPTLISNLDCKLVASGEPEYRVVYHSSLPEDAQTILTSLLDTYKAHVTDLQNRDIDSYKSKLYELEYVAKNDLKELGRGQNTEEKQEVLYRLEDVERKIVDLELMTGSASDLPVGIVILKAPTYGEPVFPILTNFLIGGSAIGFGLGCLVVLCGKLFWW